jgi:hypothetical protein
VIGANGLEVLPIEDRRRIAAMWEAADAQATREGFTLKDVRDDLLTLFQGRVSLIKTEDDLTRARTAAAQLVATMAHGARTRDFHVLTGFFLTEALFSLRHLYPLTD